MPATKSLRRLNQAIPPLANRFVHDTNRPLASTLPPYHDTGEQSKILRQLSLSSTPSSTRPNLRKSPPSTSRYLAWFALPAIHPSPSYLSIFCHAQSTLSIHSETSGLILHLRVIYAVLSDSIGQIQIPPAVAAKPCVGMTSNSSCRPSWLDWTYLDTTIFVGSPSFTIKFQKTTSSVTNHTINDSSFAVTKLHSLIQNIPPIGDCVHLLIVCAWTNPIEPRHAVWMSDDVLSKLEMVPPIPA